MLPAQKMATLTVGDRAAAPPAGCGHFLPPRRHETQATKGEEKPSCGLVSGAKCVLQGRVWLILCHGLPAAGGPCGGAADWASR